MAHAIEVNSVSKTFHLGSKLLWARRLQQPVHALVEVSLTVRQGEVYGLVGRNGYGKSTLIKCICSLIEPSGGKIVVLGMDAQQERQALRRAIGYVGSDERSFYWRLTGRQNLRFFARLHGIEARAADRGIGALSERFGVVPLLDRRFQEYSTGNRQRLSIVRALLHDPTILILDEPTRSLDPFAADTLRSALVAWCHEDGRRSVLITSHNLAEVEQLSHRVGIMSRGRLRDQGTLSELRSRFDDRERVRIWYRSSRPLQPEVFAQVMTHDLTIREDSGPHSYVEFRHRAQDDVLHAVIEAMLQQQATVVSFDRMEMSLQDIIDRVDGAEAEA